MRKAATASTPTMDIINTGNNWKLVTATTLKTMTLEFEMVNFTMKVILRKVLQCTAVGSFNDRNLKSRFLVKLYDQSVTVM